MATRVPECRICGGRELEELLSLGDIPAVNSFLDPGKTAAERKYPLAIAYCPACTLVQLTHLLDPRDLFEDYIYFSSNSESVVRWGVQLAARYLRELALTPDDRVVELASNDGCILKPFLGKAAVLGVEPAKNIAEVANRAGIETVAEFFNAKTAAELRKSHGAAKLILARNVLAHVPEVLDFVRGVAHLLADDGVFHVEVPYLGRLVEHVEFDTIYHEHVSYFSITALARLFHDGGLELVEVEEIPLHGGSVIARGRRGDGVPQANAAAFIAREAKEATTRRAGLIAFSERTRRLKTAIPEFLQEEKRRGTKLAAYGAAAKGVVLTNYCDIGTELLPYVADRSPYKKGKWTPGKHIPVVGVEHIEADRPDALCLLAWNFYEEIARQLSSYSARGGRFILPIPEPRYADGSEQRRPEEKT